MDLIFGSPSEFTEDLPAVTLPAATLVMWYLAWTLNPAAILWWRYRRLTP